MKKIILHVVILLALSCGTQAADNINQASSENSKTVKKVKSKYIFNGVVNDMISIKDETDLENILYVENNTMLDDGCVATISGINCYVPEKKQTFDKVNEKESKFCVNIESIVNIININTLKKIDIPVIGELPYIIINDYEYVFASKEKQKMVLELFEAQIVKKFATDNYKVIVLKKNTLKLLGGM